MALVTYLPPADRLCEPSPGTLRITLSNSDQGRHLHGTLRGHCEAPTVLLIHKQTAAVRLWR